MSNLRNVKGQSRKRDKERVTEKSWQILLRIFALTRMRNHQTLKWWSLVQAVAYYGWGVGRTALDATNLWGLTCGARTRDYCLAFLTKKLTECQIRYFSTEDSLMFCIDNYQVGPNLCTPRGGRGNNHLSETNQMAHKMNMFKDEEDDDFYADLSYTPDQDYISPKLMPAYKECQEQSSSQFFLHHKDMP